MAYPNQFDLSITLLQVKKHYEAYKHKKMGGGHIECYHIFIECSYLPCRLIGTAEMDF